MTTAKDQGPQGITITLTMDDVAGAWEMAAASDQFREMAQYGRFECIDRSIEDWSEDEMTSIADRLIASPDYDQGTMLWCDRYMDALLLAKVHRGTGHTAYVLWDTAPRDDGTALGAVVLTSWAMPQG